MRDGGGSQKEKECGNEVLGMCYDGASQATAKMGVYFPQEEIVCLLLIRRNKRNVFTSEG